MIFWEMQLTYKSDNLHKRGGVDIIPTPCYTLSQRWNPSTRYQRRNKPFLTNHFFGNYKIMEQTNNAAAPETNEAATNATPETSAAPAAPAPVELTQEQKDKLHADIKATFNNKVDVKEVKFNFRKVKDPESGVETKRNAVTLSLPVPSVEGIIDILQAGGLQLELLQEAVAAVIIDQAREYVNDNEAVDATNFPYATMSWEAIANLPKAERRGGGIAKELWEDFGKDYLAVMPAVLNKPIKSVELAVKVFLTKFSAVKTDKKVLGLLKSYLAMYLNASPNAEQFAECVEFLDKKAETLLSADSSNLLENL